MQPRSARTHRRPACRDSGNTRGTVSNEHGRETAAPFTAPSPSSHSQALAHRKVSVRRATDNSGLGGGDRHFRVHWSLNVSAALPTFSISLQRLRGDDHYQLRAPAALAAISWTKTSLLYRLCTAWGTLLRDSHPQNHCGHVRDRGNGNHGYGNRIKAYRQLAG